MYKKLLLITFPLFSFFYLSSYGFTADTITTHKTDTTANRRPVKIGVTYVNNNVYVGRSSNIHTPILSPDAKYTFNSGIYFSGTLNILPNNAKHKVDGGDLTAGYDFDITDDLSASTSYTKLFYSSNSVLVGSTVSSTLSAELDYNIGTVITPSVSLDYNINTQGIANDFLISAALSHDIEIKKIFDKRDYIFISPSATANFGTQNFYGGFVTKKAFKSAKRTAAQNALVNQFQQQLSKFNLLDYELSLPLLYKAGRFIFNFAPTYAIVENQFKSATVVKALTLSDAYTVLYFTTGVAVKF